MKIVLFYSSMVAGAVLLEQMVDATKIVRAEEVIKRFVRG